MCRVQRREAMAHLCNLLLLPLCLLSTFLVPTALTQNAVLPGTPPHRFFDRQKTIAFALLGGLVAVDAARIQSMLETHRYVEGNPFARPLVRQG